MLGGNKTNPEKLAKELVSRHFVRRRDDYGGCLCRLRSRYYCNQRCAHIRPPSLKPLSPAFCAGQRRAQPASSVQLRRSPECPIFLSTQDCS
jgi:hypothetical protein